ncbi:MAG: integrase [Candidatus Poriferisodalaceae bacterium]|jgi:integrase
MASIEPRTTPGGETRYDVRYRGPDRRPRKKSFKRKTDAQRYASTIEADLARHDWVDPQRGRKPFGEWALAWSETTTHLKPKTRESYDSILNNHLLPEFEHRAIGSIDHAEVLAFLSGLTNQGKGAGTVRNIRDVMRLVFKLAVRAGAIKTNPVDGVKSPRAQKAEMIFLTEHQVMDLAEEVQDPPPLQRGHKHRDGGYPDYSLLVRFAAFTGLRAGELGALKVSRINLMRRRVEVSQSADEANGKFNIGPTKTYQRRALGHARGPRRHSPIPTTDHRQTTQQLIALRRRQRTPSSTAQRSRPIKKATITMKIQVNTDSSVEGSDAHTLTVETTIHTTLDRYGDRLTRVEAHLSAHNNAVGENQTEVRCLL